MFKKMLQWIRSQLDQLFNNAIGTDDVAISGKMENALSLWLQVYETGGPWCNAKTGLHSLDIGGGVAREFARLVLLELNMEVSGSPRADWIMNQLRPFLESLPVAVEMACALGGGYFKPYVCGSGLYIEAVQADCAVPTTFDTSGRMMTGCIFSEQIHRKGQIYTRLEHHEFDVVNHWEVIEQKAFVSSTSQQLGAAIPLTSVPEWAGLSPTATVHDIDRPLFAYFKIPAANRADRHSPLGTSVFAPAISTIRDADAQYGSLLWEYRGGELAIDVAESALRKDSTGHVSMDAREKRLYRSFILDTISANGKTLYEAFAPTLRDESYRKGLDAMLKRIEFQCGLAYGTLSDPQSVEKTAEEVKMSRQRSYATVRTIQTALQHALDHLVYIMDVYATVYSLAPAGEVKTTYDWDDSLVNDPDDRRTRFWSYVLSGKFPMARYLTDYEHYTDEDAAAAVAAAKAENTTETPEEMLTFGEE